MKASGSGFSGSDQKRRSDSLALLRPQERIRPGRILQFGAFGHQDGGSAEIEAVLIVPNRRVTVALLSKLFNI